MKRRSLKCLMRGLKSRLKRTAKGSATSGASAHTDRRSGGEACDSAILRIANSFRKLHQITRPRFHFLLRENLQVWYKHVVCLRNEAAIDSAETILLSSGVLISNTLSADYADFLGISV